MPMLERIALATLCVAGLIASGMAAAPPDPSATTVARDGNAFAVDLYGRLRSGQQGNLFLSPQSISTALAMTYAGARGDTAAQMARTLHLSLPQDQVPAAYAALLKILNPGGADRGYQLLIANRLWGARRRAVPRCVPRDHATRLRCRARYGRFQDQRQRRARRDQRVGAPEDREQDPGSHPGGCSRSCHATRARQRDLLPRRLGEAVR